MSIGKIKNIFVDNKYNHSDRIVTCINDFGENNIKKIVLEQEMVRNDNTNTQTIHKSSGFNNN